MRLRVCLEPVFPYDSAHGQTLFCLWLFPRTWQFSHFGDLCTCQVTFFFFPFCFLSESSEEESTGEREEEIGAHNKVASSTRATEVPAEQTSNTQTGEG